MKEARLVKYYFVRYFFLAFGLLQGLAAILLFVQFPDSPKNRFAFFVFFTLALVLFSLHLIFFSKVKRVALSKKKVSIMLGDRTKHYDWNEVKELKLLNFLNLYKLKLKGKPQIYFLSTLESAALFGLFPDEPEFLSKKTTKI